ncbi:MAG TPA: helix-turn-helix transcriptional regulator [Polyangia bacterium]|nr:helix-turn-helix transcriptional regulator [Polyangia bacterium]
MRRDLISIVEAGYRLDGDDRAWLTSVLEMVRPQLDSGFGVIGWSFAEGGRRRDAPVCVGCPQEFGVAVEQAHQIVSEGMRSAYEYPRLYSSLHRRLGGRGLRDFPQVLDLMKMGGIGDFVALSAPDVDGSGVIIGAPAKRVEQPAPHTARMWERVAGHLAAALRLRHATQRRAEAERDPEAVVSTDGRVEHARGDDATRARSSLRSAALAAERARGRLRHDDPARALGFWKGLVEARWSLIDRFDSGGRRYLVAVRNDPRVPHPGALTERERQVVALAAFGRSNKSIAYELGLSLGVVGAYLASAVRKLNVTSRVELVRLYAALGGRDPEPQ